MEIDLDRHARTAINVSVLPRGTVTFESIVAERTRGVIIATATGTCVAHSPRTRLGKCLGDMVCSVCFSVGVYVYVLAYVCVR